MKKNVFFLLAGWLVSLSQPCSVLACSSSSKEAQTMVTSQAQPLIFDEIPLMPGLQIVRETNLIVLWGPAEPADVVAEGMVDIDDLYTFYQTGLPALGWLEINGKTFYRGDQQIVVDAKSSNNLGLTIVRFSKGPVQSSY